MWLFPKVFCAPPPPHAGIPPSAISVGEDDNASPRQYYIRSTAPKDAVLVYQSRDTAFAPSKDVLRPAGQMLLVKPALAVNVATCPWLQAGRSARMLGES